jgi:hypothetical protein
VILAGRFSPSEPRQKETRRVEFNSLLSITRSSNASVASITCAMKSLTHHSNAALTCPEEGALEPMPRLRRDGGITADQARVREVVGS